MVIVSTCPLRETFGLFRVDSSFYNSGILGIKWKSPSYSRYSREWGGGKGSLFQPDVMVNVLGRWLVILLD